MNKRILGLIPLIVLLGCVQTFARELRTPWSLQRGAMHHPLPWPTAEDECWNIETWGGALHRESNRAFLNKDTTKTENLSALIFGAPEFFVLDAFAPETFSPNPTLGVLQVRPRIEYNENSAYFGFNFEHSFGCDRRWHAGARAVLTFRSIRTGLEDCCDLEETIEDVRCLQNERINGAGLIPIANPVVQTINNVGGGNGPCFVYRMDFVSSLFLATAGVPPFDPFLHLHDVGKDDVTTIGDELIISGPTANNPINLIRSVDKPTGVFCATQDIVNALPFLQADGSGGANGDRLRGFSENIDYTPLKGNLAAQRDLWFAPTVVTNGTGPNNMQIATAAQQTRDAIEQLIRTINGGPVEFLNSKGITFATQHIAGAGDLDTEFFVNYEFCRGLVEGIFGIRFPTGIKIDDPNRLLSIFSTGNNRHFEVKFGGMGTWEPVCWFGLKADALWSYVIRGNEKVAAPFAGATIKNIGPTTNAEISWHWFQGNLDFTFLVPCNPRVGFMVGYEFYAKGKDKVSLKQTTATDLLGNTKPLDASVLERRTNVLAHKVRTEMFHQGNYWELFAGWTHVFAGKNAPKETDWHLGVAAYF